MNHNVFVTVTRLFDTAGSQRVAWRALLARVFLEAITRSGAA